MKRSLALFFVCIALSLLGSYYAIVKSGFKLDDLQILNQIGPWHIIMILTFGVGIYISDAFRYMILGHFLKQKIYFLKALELSAVNFYFSWISPWSFLGPASVMLMLKKEGVPVENSVLISFGKSIVGAFLLFSSSFVVLLLFPGNLWGNQLIMAPLLSVLGFYVVFLSLSVSLSYFETAHLKMMTFKSDFPYLPAFLNKTLMMISQSLGNTAKKTRSLYQIGLKGLAAYLFFNALYFLIFIGMLVYLLHALGAVPVGKSFAPALLHTTLAYISPSPNGAGIAEALIHIFFEGLLPLKAALVCVLLYRISTFYIQMLVGLFYTIFVLKDYFTKG
ncbi:MAG: flippase-like domain-containing protein [Bdellovibrio sp.]|nr:flippase-like domain-containing protein [Bdellovibrio sp.]